MPEQPIINCHTHVFTVEDVPPKLARTIAPWPLSWLLDTRWIAGVFGFFTRKGQAIKASSRYKRFARALYGFRMALKRFFILRLVKILLAVLILSSIFHDQYPVLLKPILTNYSINTNLPDKFHVWLASSGFIIITSSWVLKALLLIVFLVLFPSGRNLVFFMLRKANSFFKLLPGKQMTELLKRYLNIIRFANYKEQWIVYSRLIKQYPPGSKMIVLPMDMAYMGAGKPKRSYADQMALLAKIKQNHKRECFPFVFVDPRRMEDEGNKFFNYSVENGTIKLEDCFIKEYILDKDFSGFKIYPALGYFPFDERLLALWKYAADNGIPIMTHCIRGVIYYRGKKDPKWDTHPVFDEYLGPDDPNYIAQASDYRSMLLPQMKAVDVQEIFTHPLNYACLLKKKITGKNCKGSSKPV